ncbi:MAG: hypothetical protein WC011_03915 [Candidatus Paceibacterota bacterium]
MLESIKQFIENLTTTQIIVDIIILTMIIVEITARILKRNIKEKFKKEKRNIEEFEEIEKVSIAYYKQYQWIDIFRLFSLLIGFVFIIITLNIQALNILAVVAGAIIIILREFIFSFFSFFYLISIYRTGDDIKIEETLGEILRINPLYIALAGKDEDGEYNGKLHRIPNFTFIGKNVELQDLKTDDYRRVVLKGIYNIESFDDPFSVWIEKLRNFLDEKLPQRHIGRVGNYKGYTGIKYKLNFDYGEKGEIICRISFVARHPYNIKLKEEIIEFIESLRKIKTEEKIDKKD